MKDRGKKGISPLIATVILIGFVVAIAAVVMLWGRGIVEETAEKQGEISQAKLACQDVDFKITLIGGVYHFENTGSETIDSFVIRTIGGEAKPIQANLMPWTSKSASELDIQALGPGYEIVPRLRPKGAGAPAVPCSNALKTLI